MTVYVIPLFSLIFLSFKDLLLNKNSKKTDRFIVSVFLVYMILLASLREGIGVDFYTYKQLFNEINQVGDHSYLEFGFRFIVILGKMLFSNIQSLFFVFSFITLYPLKKILIKYSDSPVLSILIYFSLFYPTYVFNGIRQGIVMTIFLLSLDSIFKRENLKVVFWTLIGILFHYSGILILLAYLYSLKFNVKSRKKNLLIIIIFLLFFLVKSNISPYILKLLPNLISSKIVSYMNSYKTPVNLVGIMQRFLVLFLILLNFEKLKGIDRFLTFFSMYQFGFLIYVIFSFQEQFATRLNMFLRILEIIIVPMIFTVNTKIKDKMLYFFIVVFWMFLIVLVWMNNVYYVPYRSIFSLFYS